MNLTKTRVAALILVSEGKVSYKMDLGSQVGGYFVGYTRQNITPYKWLKKNGLIIHAPSMHLKPVLVTKKGEEALALIEPTG